MAIFHLLSHLQCKEGVQSRVLTVNIAENVYNRQQLVADIAEWFQDVDHRLTRLHIDQYVVIYVKSGHGWIEIPSNVINLLTFLRILHIESQKLIELKVEFVENMELKYLATEFSSQLLDAALLSDRINEEADNTFTTNLAVKLDNELNTFESIIRSEHYLELSFGLKYYLAVKDHRLFVVIRCQCSNTSKHELERLANTLNIDYLHNLIEKVSFVTIKTNVFSANLCDL